jgi:hypothetical protein
VGPGSTRVATRTVRRGQNRAARIERSAMTTPPIRAHDGSATGRGMRTRRLD